MPSRHSAQAIRRQEAVLVEKVGQDADAAASGDPDDHPALAADVHQDAGVADILLVDAAPAGAIAAKPLRMA